MIYYERRKAPGKHKQKEEEGEELLIDTLLVRPQLITGDLIYYYNKHLQGE